MSLMTFGVLFVLLVAGAFGFIFFYSPPIAGTYDGFAQDLPMGASGPLLLTLVETEGRFTGQLVLPPEMKQGGGALSGRLQDGQILFVTTDAEGQKMTWVASIGSRSLSGRYWWGEIDEASLPNVDALGIWRAGMRR